MLDQTKREAERRVGTDVGRDKLSIPIPTGVTTAATAKEVFPVNFPSFLPATRS